MSRADDWLPELEAVFLSALGRVRDESFGAPSPLPGWTTGHLVAHVHFNALALCRLVGWARTGVEAAMYASAAQRAEEIEDGARQQPAHLRALVAESSRRFTTEFTGLSEKGREHVVVTAQGRHIPASELAWLRCRELGVHAIDLGVGLGFADLPSGFVDTLVSEIVAKRLAGGEGPTLAGWLSGRFVRDPLDRWL